LDIAAARTLLRKEILDCPGIERLDLLEVGFEAVTRNLDVNFVAFAVDGSRIEGLSPLLVNGAEVTPPSTYEIGGDGDGVGVDLGIGGSIT
jgi:hypothetical protein